MILPEMLHAHHLQTLTIWKIVSLKTQRRALGLVREEKKCKLLVLLWHLKGTKIQGQTVICCLQCWKKNLSGSVLS